MEVEDGACVLHDLFREAALAALSRQEIEEARSWLAERSHAISLDPVVSVRELVRHLVALEREEDAGDRLISASLDLVKRGAAGELLRSIERIPPNARTPQLSLIRARTLARVLDFRGAYHELDRLTQVPGLADIVSLPMAQIALLFGRLEVAERAAERCVRQSDPPVLAHVALALVWSYRGRGESARDYLEELEQRAVHAIDRGTLAICRAFSAWIDGDLDLAEEAMREALARFREVPEARRTKVFANGIMGEILARRGRFDEADRFHELAIAAAGDRVDPRLAIYLRCMRASRAFESGRRLEVVAELEQLRREFDGAGYLLAKLWTETLLVRVLFALGRRLRASELLLEATATADEHGVEAARRQLEDAREEDPLLAIAQRRWPPRPTRGHAVRDRVLAALAETAMGHRERAEAILSMLPRLIEEPGFGLDRAIAMLARGAPIDAARAMAEDERADPDLIDALARSLERVSYQVIVDGRSHQLHANGRVVSLGRRRAVRRILYRLAAHAGSVVSRDDLAQALWTRSYDPLVHENALKSNISNLRKVIDQAPLAVEADDLGYRLVVPERFLFLPEA